MVNKTKLKKLHSTLRKELKEYESLILEGSSITDDFWIKGRSDYDVVLIFEKITNKTLSKLTKILKEFDFEKEYFFVPLEKEFFISPRENTYDFSSKFKSKTLYGKDYIKDKKLPSRIIVKHIFEYNTKNVIKKIDQRIVNSSFWPVTKIRDTFWKVFKDSFRFLALKVYLDSGKYPSSRLECAKYFRNTNLKAVALVLKDIDNTPKNEIISLAKKLRSELKKIRR